GRLLDGNEPRFADGDVVRRGAAPDDLELPGERFSRRCSATAIERRDRDRIEVRDDVARGGITATEETEHTATALGKFRSDVNGDNRGGSRPRSRSPSRSRYASGGD